MSGMMEGQANTSIPLVDDNDPLLPLRLRMDEIGSNLDLDVLMDRMISKEPSSLDRVTRSRSRERLIRSPSRDHRRSRSPPRDLYRRSRSPSGNLYRGSRSPGNLYRSSKSPSWDINRSRSPYRDHRRSKSRSRDRRRRSSSWDKRSDRSNDWRNSRDCHSHSRTSRRKLVVDGRNPGNQMSHVEQDNRTLFIMQMSSTVSTRELEAFFSAVGDVRDVRMIQAPVCLAYVQFEDLESVPRALQLSGRKLFGEAVIIKPTQVSITQIVRATTQHQMETPKPTKTRQSSPPRLAPGPSWTAGSRPINIHHSIPSRPQESSLRTIPKRSTMDRAVVIGHSFVADLKDHLSGELSHGEVVSPGEVALALRICDNISEVHLCGTRGAMIQDLPTDLEVLSPTIIVVDIGSNDIHAGVDPIVAANELVHKAKGLSLSYGAQVMICTALHRDHLKDKQYIVKFNTEIDRFNSHIKLLTTQEQKVHYSTHRGFWSVPVSEWSTDGIHPNQPLGRRKYVSCLRRAILTAASFNKHKHLDPLSQ